MKKLILVILFFSTSCYLAGASAPTVTTSKPDSAKAAAVAKAKADSISKAKKDAETKATAAATAKADSVSKAKKDAEAKAAIAESNTKNADVIRHWIGWILIIGLIVLFFSMAWFSDLLRAPIQDATGFMAAASLIPAFKGKGINDIPKPFSLARSQLAVWTAVIGCSYLYMELCKCSGVPVTVIDKTLLGLMGISAATAAAGNVIDNNATPDQQAAPSPSEGFFKDIMSDQNGINIHRFQNVVWTLIAVTLYLSQIPEVACGHLPTLDPTLVSLTAISSVTYLGLKINENVPPAIPPAPKTE